MPQTATPEGFTDAEWSRVLHVDAWRKSLTHLEISLPVHDQVAHLLAGHPELPSDAVGRLAVWLYYADQLAWPRRAQNVSPWGLAMYGSTEKWYARARTMLSFVEGV